MDLIESKSSEAKKMALSQLYGDLSKLITSFRDRLKNLLSSIEVNIDYPEYYDIEIVTEEKIAKEVERVANEINTELAGKDPLFISVLNGAFMFTSDLMKHITIPCQISFVKLASYQGVASTGKVKEVIGLNEDIAGRTIVIVEDIVDTGLTMQRLLETLGTRNPKEIYIASLLVKPEKLKVDLDINFIAFNIPNDFILGYGLDYDGYARNLRQIYTVVE